MTPPLATKIYFQIMKIIIVMINADYHRFSIPVEVLGYFYT